MKKRIYSGKKYLSNISSSRKKEIWHYTYKYEGQKSYWARTEESPEEYRIRIQSEKMTIKYKSKEFTLAELEEMKHSLKKKYLYDFETNELLSEEEKLLKKDAGRWKSLQRSKRRKGALSQDKVDRLNEMGMVWNPTKSDWDKNFINFKKNGLNTDIEDWINQQRDLYKLNKMPKENYKRLKALNFPFENIKDEEIKLSYSKIFELIEELHKMREEFELSEKKKYN